LATVLIIKARITNIIFIIILPSYHLFHGSLRFTVQLRIVVLAGFKLSTLSVLGVHAYHWTFHLANSIDAQAQHQKKRSDHPKYPNHPSVHHCSTGSNNSSNSCSFSLTFKSPKSNE